MSIETTLVQVGLIRQDLADPAALINQGTAVTGGTEAPESGEGLGEPGIAGSSFASALAQAASGYAPAAATPAAAGGQLSAPAAPYGSGLLGATGTLGPPLGASANTPGGRIVAAAETQIGQSEQPPGSNESPAIAAYREATVGAEPGAPWCAYFASWAARQAGEPIGPAGEGLGSVGAIWSWAQSSGRAIPNGPGVVPQSGDLIVFGDSHVGIVKEVLPSGQIATIEGNYENKVAANVRSPGEATGYVNMG
jgi:CHAP domain